MNLLDPSKLSLLLLILLFAVLFAWRNLARQRALARLGDPELIQRLVNRVSPSLRRLKSGLWLMALALLVFALARPTFGSETYTTEPIGAEVVFIVDTSLSMDSQDIAPSRLSRARLDAIDLANQIEGSSISIVLFAGIATHYMPATLDVRATKLFLKGISTQSVQIQGTALAAALTLANGQFDKNPETPAIVVVFSDGEDHQGDLDVALQASQETQITIYTLGYGTEVGAPIPLQVTDGQPAQFKQDASGGLIITALQADTLRKLADETGGQYTQPTTSQDMATLGTAIRDLQGGALASQTVEQPAEQFQIPLVLAILLLAISILLPQSRRGIA